MLQLDSKTIEEVIRIIEDRKGFQVVCRQGAVQAYKYSQVIAYNAVIAVLDSLKSELEHMAIEGKGRERIPVQHVTYLEATKEPTNPCGIHQISDLTKQKDREKS